MFLEKESWDFAQTLLISQLLLGCCSGMVGNGIQLLQ